MNYVKCIIGKPVPTHSDQDDDAADGNDDDRADDGYLHDHFMPFFSTYCLLDVFFPCLCSQNLYTYVDMLDLVAPI